MQYRHIIYRVVFIVGLWLMLWPSISFAASVTLTPEEQDYVAHAGTITVGQLPNRFPISNVDKETGEVTGINEDVLDLIAEKTGLKFQSMPIDVNEKPMEALHKGTFDMVMGVLQTNNFQNDATIQLSDPFISSTMAVVMRKGDTFDTSKTYTIALKSSFQAMSEYVSAKHPNYTVKFFSTDEECIKAVQSGEVDLMMQNVHVTSYLLQKPQYSDVQIQPSTFLSESNCMATLAQTDPRLMSIIDKGIAHISSDELNNIILANTSAQPYQLTTTDVLYKYRFPIGAIVVLGALILFLMIMIIVTRQRNLTAMEDKNNQLAQAVADADAANSAKSEFLSRMSHEIRTPMNAIVGLTTIAKQHKEEPEKMDDYLSKIAVSSKVLLNIINDVLDMSAIEEGKLKIASTNFDIKQVLTGISTIYYSQCKDKGITFTMATDLAEENLMGDSLRVNQILLNLVSNAFKFTEAGGEIKILAQESKRVGNQVHLCFKVSDTGCGMTPEMQERLFKPFEQESATTVQKHGGSGLGMSIAKNLVEMMNGTITVDSQKGKGTTFTVKLPFTVAPSDEQTDAGTITNMRALIVDDDESVREYTSIVLGRIGLAYDAADSGTEALARIETARKEGHPYDVCFIDWKMPDMDGIALTKHIRRMSGDAPIIIIVSAYDINEVEAEARMAGADMFVSKPLFQSTVFNVLMTLSGGALKHETAACESYDFAGYRVLLAEDNELNTEIATELLSLVGMEVDCAGDGKQVVDLFNASTPGTYCGILMDIQMPILDGYEATQTIRELTHKEAKTIPIYAMTANAFNEDIADAIKSGMNGHIAKPIDTEQLYRTLAAMIQTTKAITSDDK